MSLWFAPAESMPSLILARVFYGLGAGGIFAKGAILVNDLILIHIRGFY